jgi:hypothetical protein
MRAMVSHRDIVRSLIPPQVKLTGAPFRTREPPLVGTDLCLPDKLGEMRPQRNDGVAPSPRRGHSYVNKMNTRMIAALLPVLATPSMVPTPQVQMSPVFIVVFLFSSWVTSKVP